MCRHYLAPQLASISLDQSLLDSPNQSSQFPRPPQDRPAPSPKMPPPSDPNINSTSQGPPTPKSEYGKTDDTCFFLVMVLNLRLHEFSEYCTFYRIGSEQPERGPNNWEYRWRWERSSRSCRLLGGTIRIRARQQGLASVSIALLVTLSLIVTKVLKRVSILQYG